MPVSYRRAAPILWLLIKRDFQARYAGSALGAVWNAIHPLILIAIYILVFSRIMTDRAGGGSMLSYAVHLTSGVVPWFLFQEIVGRSTTSLVDNAQFLKKIAMPLEVLHASVVANAFAVHGLSLLALAALLALAGIPPSPWFLAAFGTMAALAVFAVGLGMFLSVLHVVLRDIGQLVTITLQFLFWLTPIVYFPTILPDKVERIVLLNPLTSYVSSIQALFRSPSHCFSTAMLPAMLILPPLALAIGLAFLRRHRQEILDQI